MNYLNVLQLSKTAAKRNPDAGGAGVAGVSGETAVTQSNASAAPNLAEEVWRREEELKRREAEIIRRELHAEAIEALAALDMPAELAELLDYTDVEHYKASLEKLERIWQAALKKAVEARVAGSAPKTGDGKSTAAANTMREAISAYYNR